jgi:DNA-directed RNA polymerase II subunit RPB2
MEKLLRDSSLLEHHFDTFKDFVIKDLPKILVAKHVALHDGSVASFTNPQVQPPTILDYGRETKLITPDEARTRSLHYSMPVYADITLKKGVEKVDFASQVFLGYLPCLVGSDLCNAKLKLGDLGGYFIISGKEKALVSQERIAENTLFLFQGKKNLYVQALCTVANTSYRVSNKILLRPNGAIDFLIQSKEMRVPIATLLLAVSPAEQSMEEMLDSLPECLQSFLERSCAASREIANVRMAHGYLASTVASAMLAKQSYREPKRLSATQIIERFVFPNAESHAAKFIALLKCVELLQRRSVDKSFPLTDRDDWMNKRIDAAGPLMFLLTRQAWTTTLRGYKKFLNKFMSKTGSANLRKHFPREIFTAQLKYALATGNWRTSASNQVFKVGVSQGVHRYSPTSVLSLLRRVTSSYGRQLKTSAPRQLHQSTYGFICAVETPEGAPIGLIKQLCLGTKLSLELDATAIEKFLMARKKRKDPLFDVSKSTVWLDGVALFSSANTDGISRDVWQAKIEKRIHPLFSAHIERWSGDLFVRTDPGRILRPIRTRRNDLIYLSPSETRTVSIAMQGNLKAPFREFDARCIFGTTAATIPFPDHNQSPRNVYQCAMSKQAMSVPMSDFGTRMDSHFHVLQYPQKPLVSTSLARAMGEDAFPAGTNCIVAIMSWSGYNQEDSLIFNQSSVDRGLFRSDFYRTRTDCETFIKTKIVSETFEKPDQTQANAYQSLAFRHLDDDGLPTPASVVKSSDVLIGKVQRRLDNGNISSADKSLKAGKNTGVVDRVLIGDNGDGTRFVKVRTRLQKVPEIGDKFSSRHGQKVSLANASLCVRTYLTCVVTRARLG